MTPVCPTCHNMGRKVQRVTLESLLRPDERDHISNGQYYVCISPACQTVYYDEAEESSFDKSDLIVRFGLKETESPRPVCYCFDHTAEEIEEEIRCTGWSFVMEDIKEKMKEPGCRCEYTNPLGRCCLKTVRAAVAEGFRLAGYNKLKLIDLISRRLEKPEELRLEKPEEPCLEKPEESRLKKQVEPRASARAVSRIPTTSNTPESPRIVLPRWNLGVFWGPRGLKSAALHRKIDQFENKETSPVGAVNHADCCAGDKSISKENAMSDCCSSGQGDTNETTASAAACCQAEDTSLHASSYGDRTGVMAAGGSVLAAILSSACCWLPLLLIAFGASAAGVAGFFAAYRPLFLTLAVVLLSLGYYRLYFRKAACQAGSACATPNRRLRRVNQAMLWMATGLVGAFVFFPNYVGDLFGAPAPPNANVANAGLATAVYHIDGMTCQGCADMLGGKLAKLPNVKGVKVDFDKKTALLRFDPAKPVSPKQVIASVKAAGYSGTLSQKVKAHE